MQGLLIFNIIMASIIYITDIYAIYTLCKFNKIGKDNLEQQTEYMRQRSKQFLAFSILSISLFIASIVGYVLLVSLFDTDNISEVILGFILFAFCFQILPLITNICGYALPKLRNKKKVPSTLSSPMLEQNPVRNIPTTSNSEKEGQEINEQPNMEGGYVPSGDLTIEEQLSLLRQQWEQERPIKEQEDITYFNDNSPTIIKKYAKSVFNLVEEMGDYPFVGIFNDTETPMSSILVFPYRNSALNPLLNAIKRDGLRFAESQNQEFNKMYQELVEFFIKELKQRIKEADEWQDTYTLPLLLYTVVRNNVIKYFHNKYLSNYGYESLEDFCTNVSQADTMYYVYHYIYETDISLPLMDTYRNIRNEIKNILALQREAKLKDTLFGGSKKQTVPTERTPSTLSPIERVDRMSGEEFEIFMEHYFIQKGYKVERTPLSGDYGVDLIIEHELGGKIGVQLKCYSKKVPADAVQEVFTSLRHHNLSSGMVITNNYFQPSAIRLAADNNITLWDRNKLIEKLGE